MTTRLICANVENGTIHFIDGPKEIADLEWSGHPKFHGVFLKHMIKGEDTFGLFSSHLVKIDSGCVLEMHVHEEELELHEVIEGSGTCQLNEKIFDYYPGKMTVIPKMEKHMVRAGENGLILMAKFFPALI